MGGIIVIVTVLIIFFSGVWAKKEEGRPQRILQIYIGQIVLNLFILTWAFRSGWLAEFTPTTADFSILLNIFIGLNVPIFYLGYYLGRRDRED